MFVHCIDEQFKNQLISLGFKLLQTYKTSNKQIWVFEKNDKLSQVLTFEENNKYFLSNKLVF